MGPASRLSPLQRRRLLMAGGVSLLVHGWAAWEAEPGLSPEEQGPQPFTVTLAPRSPTLLAERSGIEASRASGAVARPAQSPQAPARAVPPAVRAGRLPADTTYYSPRELDDYPALLVPLAVDYPDRALAEQRGGRVLAAVKISAAGTVDGLTIDEAQPSGYFEESVERALRAARFSPARRSGLPVRARVLIRLEFDPASGAVGLQ